MAGNGPEAQRQGPPPPEGRREEVLQGGRSPAQRPAEGPARAALSKRRGANAPQAGGRLPQGRCVARRARAAGLSTAYRSSTVFGQLALSSLLKARSASSRPPVWQRAQ